MNALGSLLRKLSSTEWAPQCVPTFTNERVNRKLTVHSIQYRAPLVVHNNSWFIWPNNETWDQRPSTCCMPNYKNIGQHCKRNEFCFTAQYYRASHSSNPFVRLDCAQVWRRSWYTKRKSFLRVSQHNPPSVLIFHFIFWLYSTIVIMRECFKISRQPLSSVLVQFGCPSETWVCLHPYLVVFSWTLRIYNSSACAAKMLFWLI